jgi:hypothetical protein
VSHQNQGESLSFGNRDVAATAAVIRRRTRQTGAADS